MSPGPSLPEPRGSSGTYLVCASPVPGTSYSTTFLIATVEDLSHATVISRVYYCTYLLATQFFSTVVVVILGQGDINEAPRHASQF